jgi:hypothetical protein
MPECSRGNLVSHLEFAIVFIAKSCQQRQFVAVNYPAAVETSAAVLI